jgi:hypothetical protein
MNLFLFSIQIIKKFNIHEKFASGFNHANTIVQGQFQDMFVNLLINFDQNSNISNRYSKIF